MLHIQESEITITAIRVRVLGGQNVNKLSSKLKESFKHDHENQFCYFIYSYLMNRYAGYRYILHYSSELPR